MADEAQLTILKHEDWNAWRQKHPDARPDLGRAGLYKAHLDWADLSGADLHRADLCEAHLFGANLHEANLSSADLRGAVLGRAVLAKADLSGANLGGADLSGAYLCGANLNQAHLRGAVLHGTDLSRADLREALLREAHLRGAALREADLYGAILHETIFANVHLRGCKGLKECRHLGPSTVDIRTLQRSDPLPLAFLRGVGLPDNLIDYLPSLLNQAIQMYSCFISYSSADEKFARRLYADLQAKSVRCWFAPHDMPIGAKIIDAIDEAIRLRDKVLLILSEHSIESDWVEGEVTRSLDEERERKRVVLFPIRVDATVMETAKPWARLLRGQRNIGDFRRWKEHDAYAKALDRLLRDLRVGKV
jgi:hypothetical protein